MRAIAILVLAACALGAVEITTAGILGNAGEAGPGLYRAAGGGAAGLGPQLDRFGTLWERAGRGTLNRIALDGRLLASIRIGDGVSRRDRSALVGDLLVLQADQRLYVVDTAAEQPAAEHRQGLAVERIAARGADGRLLVQLKDRDANRVIWYDPASGAREALTLPEGVQRIFGLGVDPQGRPLVVVDGNSVRRQLADGSWEGAGGFAFGTPILIGDAYYGGTWHGTVQRFDLDFKPAPGVVLGGASGTFIGKLAGNYEITNPTGICRVTEDCLAIGGTTGVIHLAVRRDGEEALELVRRIGSLRGIAGHLAIDADGRIHVPLGFWEWGDGPAQPLRRGDGAKGNGQVAMFDDGHLFAAATVHGSMPGLLWGSYARGISSTAPRWTKGPRYFERGRGCTVLRDRGEGRRTLRVDADGAVVESRHAGSGEWQADLAVGALRCEPPPERITSLACLADGRVLLAADGALIELERAGDGDWRETRRRTAIADQRFGAAITIASDGRRLVISDTDHHRVLLVDAGLERVLASYGGERGDGLDLLDRPAAIALNGSRAVVFDAGNQRLVKLTITD